MEMVHAKSGATPNAFRHSIGVLGAVAQAAAI